MTNNSLNSFIDIADNSDYSIINLQFGIFQPGTWSKPRVGIAIGEYIFDLSVLEGAGFFEELFGSPSNIFAKPTLNTFIAQGHKSGTKVRMIISNLLRADEPALRDKDVIKAQTIFKQSEVRLLIPVDIGTISGPDKNS